MFRIQGVVVLLSVETTLMKKNLHRSAGFWNQLSGTDVAAIGRWNPANDMPNCSIRESETGQARVGADTHTDKIGSIRAFTDKSLL